MPAIRVEIGAAADAGYALAGVPVHVRSPITAVAFAALMLGSATRADESAPGPAPALREALRPLRLLPAAKLEKELVPALPVGIVTEAAPFHALIERAGRPSFDLLDRRGAALTELGPAISVADAEAVRSFWKTVELETEDLLGRVAAMEARYADVANLAFNASGDKERQTRKLAAVLIPLYRELLAREADFATRVGEALAGLRDGPALAWLAAAVADASPGFRRAVVDALGRAGGPEPLAVLRRVAGSDADSSVRLEAVGALARFPILEIREALIAAIGDPAWEVRALAVRMCARARLVDATEALIRALGKEDGRLRMDADDALFALVGVRLDGDAALWRRWWAENARRIEELAKQRAAEGAYDKPLGPPESWDVPDGLGAPSADAKDGRATTAAFYGIVTTSKRVIFVVDISKSMEEPSTQVPPSVPGKGAFSEPKGRAKIDIARWQLHRAVAALPPDATFDLIVFSESYRAWQPAMTDASPRSKARAHEFIDAIAANGTTNIADSLDRAFDLAGALRLAPRGRPPRASLAADTIYLLTDGDPNRGRVTAPAALLADVVARARAARIVVHAIGIGEVAGSSFLSSLAARTGGRYVGFP